MAFPLPHRIADDGDRQAAEVFDASGDGRGIGAGDAEDGVSEGGASICPGALGAARS